MGNPDLTMLSGRLHIRHGGALPGLPAPKNGSGCGGL